MFRRTKSADTATTAPVVTKEGGKGRPTPSRKEAEAAARARAKGAADRKGGNTKAARSERAAQNARIREGMRNGDERYMPTRDKGPVRRFVRDLVDSRLCMAELLLPLLVFIMLSQTISAQLSSGLWSATILIVGLDTVWLTFKVRRAVRQRFPTDSHKGVVGYALLRSMQLRWLRIPKPQVKLGGAPK
ncbi:MAG: DUF3043 domain-containing protein [Nocardioidaceae bacterium]